ncbi:MAG TPA: TetR/AcrR family transcriptional regulator [Nocardioides sp.]|nr:TetR/AcrR family transcriptional regulator [Nocardioides sp.]
MSASPQSRTEATRQGVLDAAADEFAAFGFRRTSMDAIGRRAGLSRATLYLHWSSKEQLFRDLVTQLHADRIAAMEAALEGSGDVEATLTALLLARYDRFVQLTASSPAAEELYDSHDRICGDISRAADARARELVATFLRRAVRARELDPGRADVTVDALVDILLGLGHAAKGPRPAESTPAGFEAAIAAIVRICVRGLRPA